MRATFLDAVAEESLQRDGYAVIDFLDPADVVALSDLYDELGTMPGDPQKACVDTFFCADIGYKESVHERIAEIFDPHLAEHFDDQHTLSYCFVNKWPAETSGFGLHQDICVVDETEHNSVELWAPLVDTDESNGQLWIVPGSHTWRREPRGIHNFSPAWWGVQDRIIQRHAVAEPMRAGQAVVFSHSTLHFSHPNLTSTRRLAAACDLRPREAQHIQYMARPGDDVIHAYEVTDGFWVDVNPFNFFGEIEKCRLIGTVDFTPDPITDAELDRFVAEGRAVEHEPIVHPRINHSVAYCFRCGSAEGVDGHINPNVGNVTLLCDTCAAAATAQRVA